MTRLLAPVLTFAVTTPALAHSGAHMHPHGIESSVWTMLGVAIIAVAATLAWVRK